MIFTISGENLKESINPQIWSLGRIGEWTKVMCTCYQDQENGFSMQIKTERIAWISYLLLLFLSLANL